MVKQVELSDSEIISTQESDVDRKIVSNILKLYRDKKNTVKIRTQWKAKDDMRPEAYRVFCYIGKSKESLILNTRSYDESCLMLQLKIRNVSVLEGLDSFSENIRNQILGAKDCRNCGCPEKAYFFHYNGNTYHKCHMLCDNFRFSHLTAADIDSVICLILNELD